MGSSQTDPLNALSDLGADSVPPPRPQLCLRGTSKGPAEIPTSDLHPAACLDLGLVSREMGPGREDLRAPGGWGWVNVCISLVPDLPLGDWAVENVQNSSPEFQAGAHPESGMLVLWGLRFCGIGVSLGFHL